MGNFRYKFEDRYAETQGYDFFESDKEELDHFFKTKIKPKIGDHAVIGTDSTKQTIYNLCYDCNIPLWNELYARVTNIARNCDVKLNWDEIKHVIRFTFIWFPPGGLLPPHTAVNFRALSAFNIPLRGKTVIDFYDTQDNKPSDKIESHEYFNPSFLNVNRFHGVVNATNNERMILKTHLMTVPWEKAIESVESDETVNMWDFTVPWQKRVVENYSKKNNVLSVVNDLD